MPLLETKGAASAQGFGEFLLQSAANYIEDVFSTYLYTGNGSTQTITNGIDLAGKGGLVWIKGRTDPGDGAGVPNHILFDTARGNDFFLRTPSTAAQGSGFSSLFSFLSSGFSVGNNHSINYGVNNTKYASWTFRKQAKFFDVVTYTGNGSNRTISHNLDSVPGCIIVKRTDTTADWQVYHRSLANTEYMVLNDTAAKATGATRWNSTTPTSTVFSLGTDTTVNASGGTYVAYLFAHNAGGFGLTGTDNVISCGSFTTDASGNATVNLGYEPQYLLVKGSDVGSGWQIFDTMRGWTNGGNDAFLQAQSANAENTAVNQGYPTATGFEIQGFAGPYNWIYIAIRRGPMKVPTSGTSVYMPITRLGTGAAATVTGVGFSPDFIFSKNRLTGGIGDNWSVVDRLRGITKYLQFVQTSAEDTSTDAVTSLNMDGISLGSDNSLGSWNYGVTSPNYIEEHFRRAPGFFDVVCYTGTGSATTQAHNLGVAPELLIVKSRNTGATRWCVGSSALGGWGSALFINTNAAVDIFSGIQFNSTAPTSTVFTVGSGGETNVSAYTYVAYLFASCPGVSKVGSYTGTGALQTVNCGFTGGARFVLIKRTDSTGDWYVYDSARGISSGNDPYLFLNSLSAEVTGTNYVDTTSVGFQVTAAAPAGLNANGGTYIFLAIS